MDNNAIFKLSYGLFVLTAKVGDRHNGCITNTAIQVTEKPNRVAFAVNKANLTHDMILQTKAFNISILSEEADFDLFRHFGFQSGKEVDKFKEFKDYATAPNGITYITRGTNAYISGTVISETDLGTHTLFIGDVTDMKLLSDTDSATYEYYRTNIKEQPKSTDEKTEGKVAWRCKICGYIYEGEELPEDFICPWCKHPASDFEKIYI